MRKRIVFLVSSMEGGGAERVAALLCNSWVEAGCEVTLIPTFSGHGQCAYLLDPRVRLEYLSDHVGNRSKSALNSLRRFFILRKLIRKSNPNMLVSFLTKVNIVAIISAMGLKVPIVVSERIYPPLLPLNKFWSTMRRLTYPRASCVVAQTEEMRMWLEKNCPGSNVKVIPNPVVWPLPVSSPIIRPDAWVAPNRKLLLAVGRFHRQKGFDLLLDAFSDLAQDFPDWDLVILGAGPEQEALENQRKSLELTGRVLLPGQAGNISAWYERSDVYVMSSRFEGFPNTLLEALAHGVPAVSFDCLSGPRDIIRSELSGILIQLRDGKDGLATGLRRLMSDNALRDNMKVVSKDVRNRYSMNSINELWSKLL